MSTISKNWASSKYIKPGQLLKIPGEFVSNAHNVIAHKQRHGQVHLAKDLPFPDTATPTPWGGPTKLNNNNNN